MECGQIQLKQKIICRSGKAEWNTSDVEDNKDKLMHSWNYILLPKPYSDKPNNQLYTQVLDRLICS